MSAPRHEVEDPAALEAAIDAGHEDDSVRSRLLWITGVAFAVILVIAMVAIYVLQPLMVASQEADYPPGNPLAQSYGRVEPPAPRLQVDPALDIFEHRKAEEQVLTSYGWVDEKAGVVRIPIERAMALLAERGIAAPAGQGAGAAQAVQP